VFLVYVSSLLPTRPVFFHGKRGSLLSSPRRILGHVSLSLSRFADLHLHHAIRCYQYGASDVELFAPVPWCLLRAGLDLSIQVGPGSGLAVVSGADLGSETALCLRVSRLEISKRRDT
jgi:hypothetical protein